jgi:hypothetical protein
VLALNPINLTLRLANSGSSLENAPSYKLARILSRKEAPVRAKGKYLSGANGSKIFRMREQDSPSITDELMKFDGSFGGICLEIGGSASQSQLLLFDIVDCTAHFDFL